MDVLPVNEFRGQIGEYLNQVYYAGKSFTLTKGAKKVAALVPLSLLDRLAFLEEFHQQTQASQQQVELAGSEPVADASVPITESGQTH